MKVGDEEWISVAEVARRTGYSERHVRRLCQEQRIKCLRVGRDWLTTLEAVETLKKHTKAGRPPRKR